MVVDHVEPVSTQRLDAVLQVLDILVEVTQINCGVSRVHTGDALVVNYYSTLNKDITQLFIIWISPTLGKLSQISITLDRLTDYMDRFFFDILERFSNGRKRSGDSRNWLRSASLSNFSFGGRCWLN